MPLPFSSFLKILVNIRSHAVLMYFLVFLAVSKKINGGITYEYFEVGSLYFLALQLYYVYNKTKDVKEDSYNDEALIMKNFLTRGRNSLYLIAVISAYLIYKHPLLIPVFVYCLVFILPYDKYKGIFALKTLAVTVGLFFMSVLTPCLLKDPSAYGYAGKILLNSTSLLMMAFSISVIFDLRDVRGDSLAGLNTIPVAIGENNTLVLLALIMFIPFLLVPLKELKVFDLLNYLLIVSFSCAGVWTGRKKYYDMIILLEIVFLIFFLFKM